MKTDTNQGAFSVQQIAKMAAVSESTVRFWIASSQLPAYGLPGTKKQTIWRVLQADWERFLAGRRREPA